MKARACCSCLVLAAAVLPACSSTNPEGREIVARSTRDLRSQLDEAPSFLRRELGRLNEASRTTRSLFLPEPSQVQPLSSPLVRAIAAEPQRLQELRPGLRLVADRAHVEDLHQSVAALAHPQPGATSLSMAVELQRTNDAVRTLTTLWRWSGGALSDRVDLWGTWPDSPFQDWLSVLLR
jgi:hypothetical protein